MIPNTLYLLPGETQKIDPLLRVDKADVFANIMRDTAAKIFLINATSSLHSAQHIDLKAGAPQYFQINECIFEYPDPYLSVGAGV